MIQLIETSAPPRFLLHHSNTSSSDVYAMKSLAFSVLPLLIMVEKHFTLQCIASNSSPSFMHICNVSITKYCHTSQSIGLSAKSKICIENFYGAETDT